MSEYYEEINKRNKERLFKAIKKLGRSPITKFVGYLGMDYNYVKKYIDELESEGLIKKEVETKAVYVSLNES